jgi:hypothetical protein
MEQSDRDEILSRIRRELTPAHPQWSGHAVLRRQACSSLLRNKPMDFLSRACRELNVNIDGLMEILENEEII